MARPGELTEGVWGVWPEKLALAELGSGKTRRMDADEPTRGRIARLLGLDELKALHAEMRIAPWLDGARVTGRWSAEVVQTCGVTLEPFATTLEGELDIRAAPTGSPALDAAPHRELDLEAEAEDPPEPIEDGWIALGAYVVEDLSLAIDPFPRRPDATFQAPEAPDEPSPFAELIRLKPGAPKA